MTIPVRPSRTIRPSAVCSAAAIRFGGNTGWGYHFDDVLLTASPSGGSGSLTISFVNNGGQYPGLSHVTVIGGEFVASDDGGTKPDAIPPEPATLALFGLGLAGGGDYSSFAAPPAVRS